MRPTRGLAWPVAAAVSLALAIPTLFGCSKKSTDPIVGDACQDKANQAAAALESILYAEINSTPERPADIDFQAAYTLYQDALACGATNPDANFGSAVLGVLALTSDAEVNAAFDEWRAYLAVHSPFEVQVARLRPLGVPLSIAGGPGALKLPLDLPTWSIAALASPKTHVPDPQIGRIQAIFENRVLPRLNQALTRLTIVAADPNYRFVVTPRMQGDEGASPAEIDRSDVLALRSAIALLASACHIAVAYDLNLATYDSTGLMQALTPGSGWMALRPLGATHMANAGIRLAEAVDGVDAALVSLFAETDDQSDDVIKLGPDGLSAADAESVQVALDHVRDGMAQGYTRVDDWDADPFTPDVALTIRPGQLFANPVPDWKALFPDYTVAVERRNGGSFTVFGGGNTDADVVAPADGFFQAQYVLNIQNQQVASEYYYGDEFLRTALTQIVQERYAAAQTTPNWLGNFSSFASYSGALTAGPHTVSVHYETYTQVATSFVWEPVITWDAATFDQWLWPDPTLHGLLPDMGSTAELLSTFGITAGQWSPSFRIAPPGTTPTPTRRRPLP